jgi:hypothetical protein
MDSSTRLSDFDWVNPDPIAEGGFGTVFHACYKYVPVLSALLMP